MLNPIGTQIIQTNRFILRPFTFQDAYSMYYFYLSKEEVCKYLEFEPYKSINDVYKTLEIYISRYQNPLYFHWAIVDKKTGYVIGSTSIHSINQNFNSGELGICLSNLYWKQGVGKEVLTKTIEYAQKYIGLQTIYAFYMEENNASCKLLNSLGMKRIYQNDTYIIKKNKKIKLNCVRL